MEKATKYLRPTVLGNSFTDGKAGRGIDEVKGRNLFDQGISARTTARAARCLGAGLSSVRRFPPDHPTVSYLEACLDQRLGQRLEEAMPAVLSTDDLSWSLRAAIAREMPVETIASRVNITVPELLNVWQHVAKIAAQARHAPQEPPISADQFLLFDSPARSIVHGHLPLQVAAAIADFDLDLLCQCCAARLRAENAQLMSDPDAARLFRLQDLLRTANGALKKCINDQEVGLLGPSEAMVPPISGDDAVLARYKYERLESGGTHNDSRLERWGIGLNNTWRLLRAEEAVFAKATDLLLSSAKNGMIDLPPLEVAGIVGLWSHTHAQALYRRARKLRGNFLVSDLRNVPAAPKSFAAASPDTITAIVRRFGWLRCDAEQPTYRERACRPFTVGKSDPSTAQAVDEAISIWARTGDPAAIIAVFDAQKPTCDATRLTLKSESDDTLEAIVTLSRLAWQMLTGAEHPFRKSFGEALFWRYPKIFMVEATTLKL